MRSGRAMEKCTLPSPKPAFSRSSRNRLASPTAANAPSIQISTFTFLSGASGSKAQPLARPSFTASKNALITGAAGRALAGPAGGALTGAVGRALAGAVGRALAGAAGGGPSLSGAVIAAPSPTRSSSSERLKGGNVLSRAHRAPTDARSTPGPCATQRRRRLGLDLLQGPYEMLQLIGWKHQLRGGNGLALRIETDQRDAHNSVVHAQRLYRIAEYHHGFGIGHPLLQLPFSANRARQIKPYWLSVTDIPIEHISRSNGKLCELRTLINSAGFQRHRIGLKSVITKGLTVTIPSSGSRTLRHSRTSRPVS